MFASFARHSSLTAVMAIALTAIACSGGKGNPLAPSTTASPAPTAATPPPTTTPGTATTPPSTGQGASITGNVMGITGGAGMRAQASGLSVQVIGTALTSAVDDRGGFAFDDVPSGDVQLRFTGNGTDAAVGIAGVSSQERISMTVSVSGTSAIVVSLARNSAQELRVTGVVENLDRTAMALTVAGRRVQATAATKVEEGSVHRAFADLSNGLRVEVKGQPQGDGVTATQIEILGGTSTTPAPGTTPSPGTTPAPGTGAGTEVSVRGSIASVSGACPSLSFSVAGSAVRTSSATSFLKLTCADVRGGDTVQVEGVRDSNGVIAASKVQAEDAVTTTPTPGPTPNPTPAPGASTQVNVRGAIAGVGGACPALTFSVAGTSVRTTSSTSFLKLTCASIANGTTVEVEGVRESNGTVVASKVQAEDTVTGVTPVVTEIEFIGGLSTVGGSAPNLTLTVAGRTVRTSNATIVRRSGNVVGFDALRAGQALEVKGTPAADGSVSATRLTIESDPAGAVTEVEFVGALTSVGGSASNGTLTVGGKTVKVTSATEYRGKVANAFSALKTGMRLQVKGVSQSDGSVLASRIDDEN